MIVQTNLKGELEEAFKNELEKSGKTTYSFMKEIIEERLKPGFSQPPATTDEITTTGDFEADIRSIDQSGIKTSIIKKALQELDNQKKTKNTIKKGGAFHEENCMIDMKSVLLHGKPDFHELRYMMDWWLKVGILTNVLARRGVKMSKKFMLMKEGFEVRNRPGKFDPKSSPYERSIRIQRFERKGARE